MPTPFALPAVTHLLRRLIDDAQPDDAATVLDDDKGWQVTTVAPDLIQRGPKEPPGLNLFLYHVAPNRGLRNTDARTHDAAGQRIASPPLALDLHYLLTAYGTKDYQAEILLGHAMLALHDRPVLSRDTIAAAFDPAVSVETLMAASGLDRQIESITITLESLEADGLERLWAGLQLAWRPSVSYLVTVLLLSSRARARAVPPVRTRTVTTIPLARPEILAVRAADGVHDPIEPGTTIIVEGTGLVGPAMSLVAGATELVDAIDEDAPGYPDRLTLTLPTPLPAGLLAGTRGIRIRHAVDIPGVPAPRSLVDSNIVPIALRPRVLSAAKKPSGGKPGLTVTFAHQVGERQRTEIVLVPLVAGVPQGAGYACAVPDGNYDVPPPYTAPRANLAKVWLPVPVPAGSYVVRARVDGLASVPHLPVAATRVTLP